MGPVNRTGEFFFKWRDKLPIPLALAMLPCARPRRTGWIIGLPLVLIGELIRLWGLMHIGPTTRTREICADRLVTSGPYSYCRNPLYLANLMKICGFMAVAGNPVYAMVVLGFYCVEFCTMIPYEEGFLAEKFPDAHRAYREAVPVFLPCLKPHESFTADAAQYSFADAVCSEKRTFASTAAILLLLFICGLARKGGRS